MTPARLWYALTALVAGTGVLMVLGWALLGPRGRVGALGRSATGSEGAGQERGDQAAAVGGTGWGTVGWALVPPLAWIAYTFVRGAVTGWYPYPFLDAAAHGYTSALVSTGVVAVVFLVLAAALVTLDPRLPGRDRRTVPPAPGSPGAPPAPQAADHG